METTKKDKGWLSRLLCNHDYIYLNSRARNIFLDDWYYRIVETYQCNKCGKVKKKVINWK